ncbi:MAG: hypothetical protein IKI30_04295 [Oxalobacter sp.]|nr:hypothetical protein [Oxalobacter sp.]
MSFAQTIAVRKSRIHSFLMLGMASFCLVTAGLMPTGKIGAFAYGSAYWIPLVLLILAFFLIFQWYRIPAGYQLTVTADGYFQIDPDILPSADDSMPERWEMQAGSTVWISVIILCLRTESGRKKTLVLFPDAMAVVSFQRLYTACNWRLMHLRSETPQS